MAFSSDRAMFRDTYLGEDWSHDLGAVPIVLIETLDQRQDGGRLPTPAAILLPLDGPVPNKGLQVRAGVGKVWGELLVAGVVVASAWKHKETGVKKEEV